MRIGIDLMSFRPGAMGGIEVYMRSLVSKLQEIDSGNEYMLLLNSSNKDSIEVKSGDFTKEVVPSARHSYLLRNIPLLNNAPLLKRHLANLELDVIHRPFTVSYPRIEGVREVVTIADLQFEEFPENFTRLQLYSRKRLYRKSASEADAVLTISEFAKQSIVKNYGVKPGKITVTYLAAGKEYGKKASRQAVENALAKLGVKPGYVYYPAAAWKHKNHERLFQAMKILARKGRKLELVLSGLGGGMHALELKAREMGLAGKVKALPKLDSSYLPLLYQGAKLMAFPSFYEGFGLPLVEAMASGCPVACAKLGSIPEVCGNAAAYFNAYSPESIASRIARIDSDDGFRKALIAAGRKQSAKFSWEKCARETLEVFEGVCKR